MKVELSNRLRIMVRDLAEVAHEREMRNLLRPVAESVTEWKFGKKDTWALLDDLNHFDRARHRLSQRYRTRSIAPMLVAYAIVSGILRKEEVTPELLEVLQKPMEFYKRGLEDGTISFEEVD